MMRKHLSDLLLPCLTSCLLFLACTSFSLAQVTETEPNHPCPNAQLLTGEPMPAVIAGSLDSSVESDVDFFRFSAAPFAWVEVNLEGASTGKGTLGDPFLGFFDTNCSLLQIDDDGGEGLNSRTLAMVPEDGEFVLGVTFCCDSTFSGGGEGSYELRVETIEPFGSISGRLVDESNGEPVAYSPWSYVTLIRCSESACDEYITTVWPDTEARFLIEGGLPYLRSGEYAIEASAWGYETMTTQRFLAGPYENVELGDISLIPMTLIGSISGRVVDAISGEPVSGGSPNFAQVELLQCQDPGNCWPVQYTYADEQGLFSFTNNWTLLPVGYYRLRLYAGQYVETVTDAFFVSEDEDYDAGDVRIQPLPLQFTEVLPCNPIPAQGGICRFSLGLRNGSQKRISGSVWTMGQAWGTGSTVGYSAFQVGRVGITNPAPERFNLKPGQSTMIQFQLTVPGSVQEGASLCFYALAGSNPNPVFNTLGTRDLFCIYKEYGSFRLASPKETHKQAVKGFPASNRFDPTGRP